MLRVIYLYCFLLCTTFLYLNVKKIGLKGKSAFLPSTVFFFMWGLCSLGIFLFGNGILDETGYFITNKNLDIIGEYLFAILATSAVAFSLAHYRRKTKVFFHSGSNVNIIELSSLMSKLKWFLYLLFIFGSIRFIMVLSVTGFDYSSIRQYYLLSRLSFSFFDNNLIRISNILVVISSFYICLLGIRHALTGINNKRILFSFILFSPYQMSYGGRLFILSFFVPYIFSYLIAKMSIKSSKLFDKDVIRLMNVIAITVFLIIFMQSLKKSTDNSKSSFNDNIAEVFYSTASFRYINELWLDLPEEFEFGYGLNSMPFIGNKSPIVSTIKSYWESSRNSALYCTPSMIPDMYLDFGWLFSLLMFFVLFYFIESKAIGLMQHFTLSNFIFFYMLCTFMFSTTTSSMSDNLKTLIIGLIFLKIIFRRKI